MRKYRSVVVVALALALLGGACFGSDDPPEALRRQIPLDRDEIVLAASLERFDGCAQVVDFFRDAADEMGAQALMGPTMFSGQIATGSVALDSLAAEESAAAGDAATAVPAAPSAARTAGVDYSGTNVQEEGVDEPDMVKTDGEWIYAVARQRLQVVDAGAVATVASLALDGNGQHQLLLAGDRLLVLGSAWRMIAVPEPSSSLDMAVIGGDGQELTTLTSIDVSDPRNPRVVATRELEGSLVSARMVGTTARIVVSSRPQLILDSTTASTPDEAVREAIAEADSDDLLSNTDLVECESVHRPPEFSGPGQVTVFTLDAATAAEPKDAVSVVADAQTVYATADNLYVATTRYAQETGATTTELHKFDISDEDVTRYTGSGQVRGHLLNQWSLSEHNGRLRVATTDVTGAAAPCPPNADCLPGGETESFVSVLEQEGDVLVQVGQVGGLGRGERIYAVRYLGDIGFVVTFRQTDPLYTLDLSNPREPKVLGELKILGYSAYLHPIGDGLLLGVGQDATEEGRVLGTQVSIFDVSDLANPTRIHQRGLAGGHSAAEFDHRAFLWWSPDQLAVIPVQMWEAAVASEREPAAPEPAQDRSEPGVAVDSPQPGSPFLGAVAFKADRAAGIAEHGRLSHAGRGVEDWAVQIERSLVVDGRVFTLSQAGVLANHLADLSEAGFARFVP